MWKYRILPISDDDIYDMIHYRLNLYLHPVSGSSEIMVMI